MNKDKLAEFLASTMHKDKANVESKAAAGRIVNALFGEILRTLKSGQEVFVAGFGRFRVKERAARQGRNPKTGATIQIPARKKVAFRASSVVEL